MSVVAIIPARYGSTRLPGKPLAQIGGKPMIQHVYESAAKARVLDRVIVATDDRRIEAAVKGFGGEVMMTSRRSCQRHRPLGRGGAQDQGGLAGKRAGRFAVYSAPRRLPRRCCRCGAIATIPMGTVCTAIYR